MCNQLKVEFYKLVRFPLSYVGMLVLAVVGFVYGYLRFSISAESTGQAFAMIVGDTSFMFMVALAVSWFVGADFGDRTITHEIKMGYGRWSVILSRLIAAIIPAIFIHLSLIVFTILGYIVANGFDESMFNMGNALWLGTVMLQLMAIVSMVVMICFIIKNSAAAIAVSVISAIVLCNVLRNFIGGVKAFALTCFSFAQNGDYEWLLSSSGLAIVFAIAFYVIALISFRKADIK